MYISTRKVPRKHWFAQWFVIAKSRQALPRIPDETCRLCIPLDAQILAVHELPQNAILFALDYCPKCKKQPTRVNLHE